MRLLLAIGLPVVAACSSDRPAAQIESTGQTAAGDTTSVRAANMQPSQEIYIDSVTAENPLVVYGRARTFENNVQVRVRDARGELIAHGFTTSVGEMGHHNPFVMRVWLTRSPGDSVIVESFEYSAKDGSVRSLTADTTGYPVQNTTLTLDFPTSECTSTVTVRRSAPRTVALARLLTEALVAGPDSSEASTGATSPFPRGSRVESVILRQGELTVDFNERLQNVGGSCAAQAIRTSVTRTLSRLPAVRQVLITAGGSGELALQP
ncbi:MAG: Gmad2 immunoglobulin-like domain-containing protein [Gemmatimonadaceae bacterium]